MIRLLLQFQTKIINVFNIKLAGENLVNLKLINQFKSFNIDTISILPYRDALVHKLV